MSQVRQRFTGLGWLGVACLFIGPIMSGYAYWGLSLKLAEIAKNPYTANYLSLSSELWTLGICGIISLSAFPLLLIGRSYEVINDLGTGKGVGRADPTL